MSYFCIDATTYNNLSDDQQRKLRAVASSDGIVFGDGVLMQDAASKQWQVFIDGRVDVDLASKVAALGAIMLSGNTIQEGTEYAAIEAFRTSQGIVLPEHLEARDLVSLNNVIRLHGIMPHQAYVSNGQELSLVIFDDFDDEPQDPT